MPNITYIKSLVIVLLATFALPLQAQSAPPEGCYERTYSQEHLAKNPDQIVEQIAVRFGQKAGDRIAQMSVLTAHQGHVTASGNGGQLLDQFLYCFAPQSGSKNWACSVECDGGSMEIIRADAKTLLFRTDYLLVGDSDQCGGPVDLAEKIGKRVTYKLTRVANSQCAIK